VQRGSDVHFPRSCLLWRAARDACAADVGAGLLLLLLRAILQGTKVSVNDFVMRAAALALRDTPEANAFWDSAAGAAVQQPGVDVCVAVATEGGLITPIVKAADTKSLVQVRVLEGKLQQGHWFWANSVWLLAACKS